VELDVDQDGQVAMVEFASQWSDSVVAEFQRFDLDGDGSIIPAECLSAAASGIVRSSPVTSRPAQLTSAGQMSSSTSSTSLLSTSAAASVDSRYLSYAEGRIKQYDSNGDGRLQLDELSAMSKPPSEADNDGDEQITVEEYVAYLAKQ
jgi:Ca2+-binding EF-hand superfamily protein